ncbi:GHKL domain-containing protein [Crassaminicella thermophila]|uniref:histidine kinase n=1 Tax=Crassaminicella thermophila TaxID=2599308 RepID=A0A5C0SAJ3_CRATE|nr:ATP-binding protein [Crassaminicella thermophila]QEK11040.1 GHKL domain-containing protein [Crassaminicella thermophila]
MPKKFYDRMFKEKREIFTIFFLVQVTILIGITVYWIGNKYGILDKYYASYVFENILLVVLFLNGILGIVTLYMLKEFLLLTEKEKELEIQKFKLEQMEDTNLLLHGQRHDFLNNIQVIAGMLYLGNIEKAKEYIKGFTKGMVVDNKDLNILEEVKCPHLHTLFLNKLYKCKELGIEIHYDLEKEINLENYDAIDLVRILGNLLDNAIYAVKSLDKERRKINVSIFEDMGELVFEVYQMAPIIPKEIKEKIFKRGFTTKKNEGTGMGLYNVKNIVQKYEGDITLISEEGFGTSFTVKLPIPTGVK